MGLIKAAFGAAGGILADQWKEFFRCEAIPADVLVMKGQKSAGKRSSNTKGTDNIITTGSVILVADGQCMMIVEQGAIVEFAAVHDALGLVAVFFEDNELARAAIRKGRAEPRLHDASIIQNYYVTRV